MVYLSQRQGQFNYKISMMKVSGSVLVEYHCVTKQIYLRCMEHMENVCLSLLQLLSTSNVEVYHVRHTVTTIAVINNMSSFNIHCG